MRLSWNDTADRFTIFGYIKNLQNKLGYDGVGAFGINAAAPGTQACGFNERRRHTIATNAWA